MTIGGALRRFRATFKLKQEDVAATLGLTRQAYYFYETDKATPPAQKIIDLSTAYGVSADYLLGLSDAPINPTVTDADNELIEAIVACHKALHDVLAKRGLKENDFDLQDNEQAQQETVRRADESTD